MSRSTLSTGRRLMSLVAAMALAVSMVPAAAFAETSQLSTDVPVGRAAGDDVPNINVDVPETIALNDSTDPKGINIKSLGTVSGSGDFKNNSNNAVRVKEIKCNASGLNTYFTLGTDAKATFALDEITGAEWKPDQTSAQSVYTVAANAKPSEGYVMAKGATASGTISLDLTGSTLKDAAKTAAQSPDTDNNLMKCTWVIESVRGMGPTTDEEKNAADFYLIDKRNADHPISYSLAEVKEDAEKLPSQSRGAWPYDMYYDFCTGDGTNYECKVRWNNALYPLRIIGLNQDHKTSGGMAGLTFLFNSSMTTLRNTVSPSVAVENCNWLQCNARSYLSSGDGWTRLASSVQTAITPVSKVTSDRSGITNSDDRLFLISKEEYIESAENFGVGKNRDQHYVAFEFTGTGLPTGSWLRNIQGLGGPWYVSSSGSPGGGRWTDNRTIFPAFCF